MIRTLVSISLSAFLLVGCATAYTPKWLDVMKDSAIITKDGAVEVAHGDIGMGLFDLGFGPLMLILETAALPVPILMDVVTLGGTLSEEQSAALVSAGVAAAAYGTHQNTPGPYRAAQAAPTPAVAPQAVTTTSRNPYEDATPVQASGSSGLPEPPTPTTHASTGEPHSGFTYDDTNHSQCLSIRASGQNTGSRMAYGHYQMINNCSYPLVAQICTVTDNADGSPSDSWDKFRDGAPCPGGWGGTEFTAGEVKSERTWFEFRNIRFHAYACRKGWSIVNQQDKSIYLIGEQYRCRIYH